MKTLGPLPDHLTAERKIAGVAKSRTSTGKHRWWRDDRIQHTRGEITPGTPAPGCVPAPARKRFFDLLALVVRTEPGALRQHRLKTRRQRPVGQQSCSNSSGVSSFDVTTCFSKPCHHGRIEPRGNPLAVSIRSLGPIDTRILFAQATEHRNCRTLPEPKTDRGGRAVQIKAHVIGQNLVVKDSAIIPL